MFGFRPGGVGSHETKNAQIKKTNDNINPVMLATNVYQLSAGPVLICFLFFSSGYGIQLGRIGELGLTVSWSIEGV